jgi:hypothetical protein
VNALDIVYDPLRRQLRALSVALRAGSTDRARQHARDAVALVNEATDLSLTSDDLLLALAEGARANSSGADVIERLLELGVQRQLQATGALVIDEGTARFTKDNDELRLAVKRLLGSRSSAIDSDPRWARLLAGDDAAA